MFFGLLDLPEQAGSVCREDAAAPAPVQAQLSPAGASGKPFWGSAPVFHGNRHAETCSTAAIHIHFNVYLFSVHVGGGGKLLERAALASWEKPRAAAREVQFR